MLVVDNAPSSDATRRVAERRGVRYVLEPRPGLDVARNAAVRHATGGVVAFADDDVEVHPAWLGAVRRGFVHPEVGAVTGLVLPSALDTPAQVAFEEHWTFNRGFVPRTFRPSLLDARPSRAVPVWEIGAGANMAVRRAAVEAVGLFDERLDAGAAGCSGDTELWFRLLAGGWACLYLPEAVVFHEHRREDAAFDRQIGAYMKGYTCVAPRPVRGGGAVGRAPPRGALAPPVVPPARPPAPAPRRRLAHADAGARGPRRARRRRLLPPPPPDARRRRPAPGGGRGPVSAAPLVSVVVPCFNQARFLGDAIESALSQTHERVEVVVVDDGSTDGTAGVAAAYPDVRLVRQANAGLAAARNAGLAASGGAYVAFLDADDRLRPEAVAAGLACFAAHPESTFVSGDHVRTDAEGREIPKPGAGDVGPDPYLSLLRGNYVGMHAAVLYRRGPLVAAGGFDEALAVAEDYDLYLRLARDGAAGRHGAVVAEYRIHGANMSADSALMLRGVLAVLDKQEPWVRGDAERERALGDGRRIWTDYYHAEMVDGYRARLRRDGLTAGALREGAGLVRRAPGAAGGAALRALRRRAGRAARAVVGGGAAAPPVGGVRWGGLRRTEPISRRFGYERGLPVDRYYIERFLERRAADVRGRVLEVGDDAYTRRFGGDRVDRADVLHAHAGNADATFVGDLADAATLPPDTFDCMVLTQTLHLVYDVRAALGVVHAALRPGGVLLATVPGISQIEDGEWGGTWYWGFTGLSARRLAEDAFPGGAVEVEVHGNVLASVAFLEGVAADELAPAELDHRDPLYPLLITVRARKGGAA